MAEDVKKIELDERLKGSDEQLGGSDRSDLREAPCTCYRSFDLSIRQNPLVLSLT